MEGDRIAADRQPGGAVCAKIDIRGWISPFRRLAHAGPDETGLPPLLRKSTREATIPACVSS
jgi:hypothetical protein